jgi:chitin-binding protein
MIYAIWQTSDTPDTYYSCSDVMFTAARGRPKDQSPSPARTEAGTAPGGRAPSPSASPVAGTSPAEPAGNRGLLVAAGGIAGLVLIVAVGGSVAAIRRSRIRRGL